jgi:hypothetical protein
MKTERLIGVKVGQGNKTNFLLLISRRLLVNPVTNLKIFASLIYRSFDPMKNTGNTFKESTNWFSLV